MCCTLVLRTLPDAQREIESALTRGDTRCAVATIQCVWVFCEGEDHLASVLDGVLADARRFRERLGDEAFWNLASGITIAKADYRINKEGLLAAA